MIRGYFTLDTFMRRERENVSLSYQHIVMIIIIIFLSSLLLL